MQDTSATAVFKQRLHDCASRIETRLAHWLETGADAARLPSRLKKAMCHAALGGGKRLRPFLVLESARLCGVADEEALNAAAALECVHCYSLVHDDLPAMDDDDMRRGSPTVHRAFDEATAILAGDALLTLAFEIMASPATHAQGTVRAELTLELAKAAGRAGMAGGQMLDLQAEEAKTPLTEAEIVQLQSMKTGALITFACEAGAILACAGEAERSALRRYGRLVGAAFQLADDLLDVEGDPVAVGKAVAKDARAGKATLVSLRGAAAARARLSQIEREAVAVLAPFGGRAEVLAAAAHFVATRRH